jgi:hypothetical protein
VDYLVNTVSRLLADPEEDRRVGAASRQAISRQYIWRRKVELLLKAISERLPKAGSTSFRPGTEPADVPSSDEVRRRLR